jgi:hypothetical protein
VVTLLLILLLGALWIVTCVVVVAMARGAARGDAALRDSQAGCIDEAQAEEIAGASHAPEPDS